LCGRPANTDGSHPPTIYENQRPFRAQTAKIDTRRTNTAGGRRLGRIGIPRIGIQGGVDLLTVGHGGPLQHFRDARNAELTPGFHVENLDGRRA
jgi:hypothetical protein